VARSTRLVIPIKNMYTFLASDPDQEYVYFTGSETLPSVCYILSDISIVYPFTLRVTGITSIPFYSTSNGYIVYPFTLRVTGIMRYLPFAKKTKVAAMLPDRKESKKNAIVEYLDYQITLLN